MLYIAILSLSTVLSLLSLKRIFKESLLKKEKRLRALEFEYAELDQEKLKLIQDNQGLEKEVNETVALYNLTKDICKTLDEEKIFTIFKERVSDCLGSGECQFLRPDADLSLYKGGAVFPLVIQQEMAGYLVASGITGQDKERFRILAQQFLIGFKRTLLYKKMQELSITDTLTRLFSRRHFLERFKEELRRCKKFKYKFSFLMVDIDKFKEINDQYGHLVGDAILREVSQTVKETIRQIDFVGRYGGEELSIILVETDKQQAYFAAERLRKAIESKIIKVYDEELKVTVSVGIATFSDDASTQDALLECADKALYLAKQAGRNRVSVYQK